VKPGVAQTEYIYDASTPSDFEHKLSDEYVLHPSVEESQMGRTCPQNGKRKTTKQIQYFKLSERSCGIGRSKL